MTSLPPTIIICVPQFSKVEVWSNLLMMSVCVDMCCSVVIVGESVVVVEEKLFGRKNMVIVDETER